MMSDDVLFGFNHGKLLSVGKNGDVLLKIRPEIQSRVAAILGAKLEDLQVHINGVMYLLVYAAAVVEPTEEAGAADSETVATRCTARQPKRKRRQ
jgi:hypothetical protein